MSAHAPSNRLFAVLMTAGLGFAFGCSEKTAPPTVADAASCNSSTKGSNLTSSCGGKTTNNGGNNNNNTGGNDNGGNTGDDDGGGTTTTTPASFSLCGDGLQKAAALASFGPLVSDLCVNNTISTLRQSANVYAGGTPNFSKTVQKGDTSTQMRLYTSAIYPAQVNDYWALVQLQFAKPSVYSAHYQYDHNASMQNVAVNGQTVSYRYVNDDGEGGAMDYQATTTFVTLANGQAYVAATVETHENEMMHTLTGLIVVNKKANGQTEVFTVSDQTYDHASGESDAITTRAFNAIGAQQTRDWANAPQASQAPALLTGG